MSSRTQQGLPGPDGCPAAAIIPLAHASAPGAFASHEDANGELTAIALPRALRLLNLPTDHDLAVAAAHRPSMNLVECIAAFEAMPDVEQGSFITLAMYVVAVCRSSFY